jgi:lipoprotein-anchoring transpeptidase ErfK/SrfK
METMRAAVRAVLVVMAIAATMFARPVGVHLSVSVSPDAFAIASVLPARGGVVGVAHPVVVTFSKPVSNRHEAERAVDVKSVPPMTGKFEWLDNNVVQWVPDRYWPAHSTIALSVGGVPTEFQTGAKVLGVADITNHTFTVSVDGVQAAPPPPLPAPHHRPHWGEEGVLPASMGRPNYPTPVGSYTVLSKDRSVTMDSSSVGIPVDDPDGYRLTVDYAVRITGRGLYVHSAPWAVPSMGIENVSHGCISLSPADAEWYFNAVNIGDPVIVQEGVPVPAKSVDPDNPENPEVVHKVSGF